MQEKFDIKFYNSVRKIISMPFKVYFNPEINGLENIPDKPYILAGNHTSLMDIPFLIVALEDDIHFMAKKELFSNKISNYIFSRMGAFPIDRNIADLKALKESLFILKNNEVLGVFPEGTRNKTDDLILPFKPGVSNLSIKTNSLIVPFGINGKYKFRSEIKLNIGKPIDVRNIKKSDQTKYIEEQVKKLILR